MLPYNTFLIVKNFGSVGWLRDNSWMLLGTYQSSWNVHNKINYDCFYVTFITIDNRVKCLSFWVQTGSFINYLLRVKPLRRGNILGPRDSRIKRVVDRSILISVSWLEMTIRWSDSLCTQETIKLFNLDQGYPGPETLVGSGTMSLVRHPLYTDLESKCHFRIYFGMYSSTSGGLVTVFMRDPVSHQEFKVSYFVTVRITSKVVNRLVIPFIPVIWSVYFMITLWR